MSQQINTFDINFSQDKGAQRLISNLVFPSIRNFNFDPQKYLDVFDTPLFQKIIIKGTKAYNLIKEEQSEKTIDIDADIFLDKNIIKNLIPKNSTQIPLQTIFPQLREIIDKNSQEQLQHLANLFTQEFNDKINFAELSKNPKGNYTNMIYLIQLDAIVNKYIQEFCKLGFLFPQNNDRDRCYNCKVINEIKQLNIEKSETEKSTQKIWLLKFALQFEFKQTFVKRNWTNFNTKKIAFLDITVPEPYLQIEEFNNRLSVELSPSLFIIRPTLVINNLLDMASQPQFFKKNTAKERYGKLMRLPFTEYNCAIIDKLSPKTNKEMQNLDEIARRRLQLINNPIAVAKLEEEIYQKLYGENPQLLDDYIKAKLGNNSNKEFQKLTPQQKEQYKKMFIKEKLQNIGKLGDLSKYVKTNISQMEIKYSDILAPYKEYLDIFSNSHQDYQKELKDASQKCEKFLKIENGLKISNISQKNNTNKLADGVLTKYKKITTSDNYFPKIFYNLYKPQDNLKIFYGGNTEIYRSPIMKFISFGYWKIFTNVESKERLFNTVYPSPICLDDLEINTNYFINLNLPNEISQESKIISRDFLNQNGFLIIIYPSSYLGITPKNNLRKIEINGKYYSFYNNQIKFVKKIATYQKVVIDGKIFIDKINILIFYEVSPQT